MIRLQGMKETTDCDCEQDVSVDGCLQQNSIKSLKINHLRIEYAFNPLSYESLYDLMDYSETNSSGELTRPNLIVKLRDLGYDVIVLNIPKYSTSAVGSSLENKQIDGGADFLERNGRPFYQLV